MREPPQKGLMWVGLQRLANLKRLRCKGVVEVCREPPWKDLVWVFEVFKQITQNGLHRMKGSIE